MSSRQPTPNPIPDPIPDLKRQVGAELAKQLGNWTSDWNSDDAAAWIGTDRGRISELRRGKLDRFSLETLIRYLTRLGRVVELEFHERPRRDHVRADSRPREYIERGDWMALAEADGNAARQFGQHCHVRRGPFSSLAAARHTSLTRSPLAVLRHRRSRDRTGRRCPMSMGATERHATIPKAINAPVSFHSQSVIEPLTESLARETPTYSARMAVIGSTPSARRVGTMEARNAATSNTTMAAPEDMGSDRVTP